MYPTAIRSFQRTAIRLSEQPAGASGNATVKWFVYFAGITGLLGAGTAVLYQFNQDNSIAAGFKKHGINKPAKTSEN
jgi:hypothetical protein